MHQPRACCTHRVPWPDAYCHARPPQVLAEQMQRGQLMGHERAEAMDEMSLLQLGLSAMPRVTHTAWFDMSIGGEARGRCQKAPRNTHPFFEHLGPDFVSVA